MLGASCVFLVVMTSVAVANTILSFPEEKTAVMYVTYGFFCLLVLFIIYPTTAYKLYRQSATIRPQPKNRLQKADKSGQVSTSQPQPTSSDSESTTSMHVRALKIYTAILLQLILASGFSMLAGLIGRRWMAYVFFINHIGNPVIYYCFVPKFREGVKKYTRAFFHRN